MQRQADFAFGSKLVYRHTFSRLLSRRAGSQFSISPCSRRTIKRKAVARVSYAS